MHFSTLGRQHLGGTLFVMYAEAHSDKPLEKLNKPHNFLRTVQAQASFIKDIGYGCRL